MFATLLDAFPSMKKSVIGSQGNICVQPNNFETIPTLLF